MQAVISTMSDDVLNELLVELSREKSRREGENPISQLKEWADRNPSRIVEYQYYKIEGEIFSGRIVITDEHGVLHQACAQGTNKKTLKHTLAKMGMQLI